MTHEDLRQLRYSQSEGYVEYSADGRVLKAPRRLYQKSRYEEDEFLGEHSSVWGSHFEVGTGRWGFKCCKQCIKTDSCIPLKKRSQCNNNLDGQNLQQAHQEIEGPRLPVRSNPAIKLHQVMQKLQVRDQCVQGLLDSVSLLGSSCPRSPQLLKEKLCNVEIQHQVARNLSEDLVEDVLVLDSLGGLSTEDRSARKAVLTDLETLASKVDRVKSSLLQLQHECRQEVGEAVGKKKNKNEQKSKKNARDTKCKKKKRKRKHAQFQVAKKTKKTIQQSSSSSSSSSS